MIAIYLMSIYNVFIDYVYLLTFNAFKLLIL